MFGSAQASARFEQPVAVSVGPNCVSAAESLALVLKDMPRVRLFGANTRGALSDAIPKTLPNGWRYTLSVENHFTREGQSVEAVGVAPHLAVAGSDANGTSTS
jgi:C-terminal processing protease CtpA/Prc